MPREVVQMLRPLDRSLPRTTFAETLSVVPAPAIWMAAALDLSLPAPTKAHTTAADLAPDHFYSRRWPLVLCEIAWSAKGSADVATK